jgi:hypothetical protein
MKLLVNGKENTTMSGLPAWLKCILASAKSNSKVDVFISVEKNSPTSELSYTLENKKSKIRAVLEKKKGKDLVQLTLTHRTSPDLLRINVPEEVTSLDQEYSLYNDYHTSIAKALVDGLLLKNDYWFGLVEKIKVVDIPTLSYRISGGLIIECHKGSEDVQVILSSGMVHSIPNQTANKLKVRNGMYLVMSDLVEFKLFHPSDFISYFEQI